MAPRVGLEPTTWRLTAAYSTIEFPPPTQIVKITYSVQMPTLMVGVLGVGPDVLLAALMDLTIIFTLLASYSYFKKGGYIFTC